MSLWEERAARNEALFREVNEQIERRHDGGVAHFVCECSREECTERLHLSLSVYDAIRSAPRRFLLVAGHENEQVDTVVERGDGYVVVEKDGAAGRIADRTDPRG